MGKALKFLRSRFGSPFGTSPSISGWVRSQIGTALPNRVMPLGVRVIQRLRRSSESAACNRGLSNGQSGGQPGAIHRDEGSTAAIAGGWGRFRDISSENPSTVLARRVENETRISQKSINIRGRKVRRKSTPALRKRVGNRCCRARNMDDEAINSAKHIRQRCRAIRCLPEMPPRTSMRISPAPAIRATEPRKK